MPGLANRLSKLFKYDDTTGELTLRNHYITPESLKAFADKTNLKVIKDKEGEYISIPHSYFKDDSKTISFYDNWINTFTNSTRADADRLASYQIYDIMDENMIEAGITLDTYADEAVSLGFLEHPIKINISNKQAYSTVMEVLERNKILERARADIRTMCKYGNACYTFNYPKFEEDNKNKTKASAMGVTNSTVDYNEHRFSVNDLTLTPINPKYFSIIIDPDKNIIAYKTTEEEFLQYQNIAHTSQEKIWQPWNFGNFCIEDDITYPYGKSILYSMRSLFDQLATLEALLALSRASKVTRLVIKVPTPSDNVTEAFQRVAEAKANYKSTIFSDAAGTKSGRKVTGLTEQLWMPSGDGFSIDSIRSDIDLSSVDDVDHFLDKVLRGTRLPKGYLYGEEVTDRGGALAEQDLKFARVLVPIQNAYCKGLTRLIQQILCHAGYNVEEIDVEVVLERPSRLSSDLIARYKDALDMTDKMIESWKNNISHAGLAEGEEPIFPRENYYQLLLMFGMPDDMAKLVTSNAPVNLVGQEKMSYFYIGQDVQKPMSANDFVGKQVKLRAPTQESYLTTVATSYSSKAFKGTYLNKKLVTESSVFKKYSKQKKNIKG